MDMKEIVVKVPESRFEFFMNLVRELGIEAMDTATISREQEKEVEARIMKSSKNPSRLLKWDEVKGDLL